MSIVQILTILAAIKANHKPFWQEPWKKHRRRAWKRQVASGYQRSSGYAR